MTDHKTVVRIRYLGVPNVDSYQDRNAKVRGLSYLTRIWRVVDYCLGHVFDAAFVAPRPDRELLGAATMTQT